LVGEGVSHNKTTKRREIAVIGNIFVNLPVKDLDRSKDFFTKLGFGLNLQFTDENAACIVIGDNIFAMLLREEFFKGFSKKEICDTSSCNEAIIALSADSREGVDAVATSALEAGASEVRGANDLGFMYSRDFLDPDGHMWEVLWMDPNHLEK
jgi:predicted lactoylglutathione lyase